MTQEVIDKLLHRTQSDLFTMDPCIPLFDGAIQDSQNDLENHSIFKPVSKAGKIRKTTPKASNKHKNPTLESQKTDFCGNIIFATHS